MIGVELGKRYERLLFMAAPISLAAIVVCLIAIASNKQAEKVQERCLQGAVDIFTRDLPELQAFWSEKKTKDEYWYINYRYKLMTTWIEGPRAMDCYSFISEKVTELMREDPSRIIQQFREQALKLSSSPISVYGITLPSDASVDLLLTKVTVNLVTLAKILQIVLLPVMLLWLGSLYATRYRESIIIASTHSLTQVFPHIINIYPAFSIPSARKRSALAPHLKGLISVFYAVTRIILLSVFIAPPVAAYIYSLLLIGEQDYSALFLASGVIVFIFLLQRLWLSSCLRIW